MTRESDVENVVRSWLEEGSDRLPDRVAEAVVDRLPTTPQHRSRWSPPGLSMMSRRARVAIAAAAVIVIASTATFALLPRGPEIGTVPSPTHPSPTPSPSTTTTATPIATARPAGAMDAGTYRMEAPFLAPFSVTFPSSWILRAVAASNVDFLMTDSGGGAAWVSVDLVDGVMVDPCHTTAGLVKPAPKTVDALVRAISTMVGFHAGPVTDVTIGGLPAKSFTITNSIDTDTAGCTGGPMLPLWTFPGGPAATNGGATERLWVMSVHGTLVVIDGESFPTTPAPAIEEIKTVVQSIVFE